MKGRVVLRAGRKLKLITASEGARFCVLFKKYACTATNFVFLLVPLFVPKFPSSQVSTSLYELLRGEGFPTGWIVWRMLVVDG